MIGKSPYKALFGSDPKVGLSSSSVPRDLLPDIQTEEDFLKQIMYPLTILTLTPLFPRQNIILTLRLKLTLQCPRR